jgi:hypothetical protein
LHWRFALLAMCLDISVEPCQNPSRPVWKAFGTAFMMRSAYHRPSRIAFQPSSLRCPSHKLPKRKSAFELRRSVVPVEIVDGLSEVAGQPLALRVARRRDQCCGLRGLDNCGNCLLVSKPAFVSAGQNKSLESQCEGRPPGPTMIHPIFLHSAARPME